MPRASIKKNNLTAGELSPQLLARSDLSQYSAGAAKIRNAVVTPFGGFKRRPGLRFVAELTSQAFQSFSSDGVQTTFVYSTLGLLMGTYVAADVMVVRFRDAGGYAALKVLELTTDYTVNSVTDTIQLVGVDGEPATPLASGDNLYVVSRLDVNSTPVTSSGPQIKLFEFQFNVEQTYCFIFSIFSLRVAKKTGSTWALLDNIVDPALGITGTDVVAMPYGTIATEELNGTQKNDVFIGFHRQHFPQWILRDSQNEYFTPENLEMVNIPQYDYEDSLSPSPSVARDHSEVLQLFGFDRGAADLPEVEGEHFPVINHDKFTLFINGEETSTIHWTGVGYPEYHYKANTKAVDMAARLETAIEATTAVGPEGGVTVTPIGTDARDFDVVFDIGTSKGKKWEIQSGDITDARPSHHAQNHITFNTNVEGRGNVEDVMSELRGFPRCGTFYQNRLWLAGLFSRPASVLSSRSGNFNDFNSELSFADYAVYFNLDTDKVSAIYNIAAGEHLTLFTSSSEFYIPSSKDEAVTPENLVAARTSQYGSKDTVRVFDVGGSIIYVQRFGKVIRAFNYDESRQKYVSTNLSKLSSHLIDDPVSVAYSPATDEEDADYIYFVNTDGTMAVLTLLEDDNVVAWSLWSTEGNFKQVVVVDTDTLVVVERDGSYFLEVFDESLYVDSGVSGTTSVGINDLNHLDTETVTILKDGTVQLDQVVAAGAFALTPTPTETWQAGLKFPTVHGTDDQVWVQYLPFEPDPTGQSIRGEHARTFETVIRVFETSHLRVGIDNEEESRVWDIPFREFGEDLLDSGVPVFTGLKVLPGLTPYTESNMLSLTQNLPLPCHVLGLTHKVTF